MRGCLLAFILMPLGIFATELSPWYGTAFGVELKSVNEYHHFRSVASSYHSQEYASDDYFTTLAIGSALINPWTFSTDFAAEVESTFSLTRKRTYSFDNAAMTARYRLMNDVVADPVSLVAGVTLRAPYKQALEDVGSFHHGLYELEGHLAVGKEISNRQFWCQRVFSVAKVGIAERGSPWISLDGVYEVNYCDRYRLSAFFNTLLGFGGRSLDVHDFAGYGSIAHRSIDIGVGYEHVFEYGITVTVKYAYRPLAENFPRNVSNYQLSLLYPF